MRAPVGVIVAIALLAACSGLSKPAAPTTQPLDPFATTGPPGRASTDASGESGSAASSNTPPPAPALGVGQCFDTDQFTPGATIDLSSVHVVDCAQPHQHEVFALEVEPSGPGAPYPGDDALGAFADDRCLSAFTDYTGVDYQSSHYDIANARPDADAWGRGARSVICALHDDDFAEMVGSVRATTSASS
ncbi:MAG TPA: septum formation family protein [Acidimicrobiales bacterium]|jgi:hypothetical protein